MSPPKAPVTRPSNHKTNNTIAIMTSKLTTMASLFFNTNNTPQTFSSVEVGNNSQYANNNKVNTYQIIEYLGENHDDNPENEAGYSHPKT